MLALAQRQRQLEGRAERELRARDDGALHARRRPRLHRAGRPRAGARADRLSERLDERRRQRQLPLRPERARHGREDDLRQDAARSRGRTRAASALDAPGPPVVLRAEALELLHPRRPRPRDQRALERLYIAREYEVRPVVDRDPQAPGALHGAAHGEVAGRLHRRACCARIGRGIDTTAWSWLGAMAGQQLFYPPNVAGWDDTRWLDTATWRGRWWIAAERAASRRRSTRGTTRAAVRRAGGSSHGALGVLGHTRARRRRRARRCSTSPRPRSPTPARRLEAEQYAVMVAERAAPADRGLARSCRPHERRRATAATTSRARGSSTARRARPGAACRRSSRGCRCPPARGSPGARSCSRSAGARARRLRRHRGSGSRAFEDGIAARRRGPVAAGARLDLPRGRRRRALGPLPATATRGTASCARSSALAGGGTAFSRGRPPALASRRARRSRRSTARARSRSCRRSATRTPTSRTSPRATTGRSARPTPTLRTGWLGRYLDRVGTQDNPLQGLSLCTRAAAVARDRQGPGRVDRRPGPVRLLRRRRSAARSRSRCCRRSARSATRTRRARTRPCSAAGRITAQSFGCGRSSCRSRRGTTRPASAARSRTRPRTTSSRAGWPGWPRCSRRGCRSAASRSRHRGSTTPTHSRPTSSATRLKLTADTLLAFQRDLEARGLADRVLVHVWSEFGRRAQGERRRSGPTTARPASDS